MMLHEGQMMRMENKKMERKSRRGTERSNNDEEVRFEEVDLSGMELDFVPSSNLNLSMISKLDLSSNNLETIPESLTARLVNLLVFDVHSNQLKSLPNSIGCLSKVKVLNISANQLQFLPKTIENCRCLEELNANFNQLKKLPDTIGFELVNLKKLSVNSNKLDFLPYSTSHLTNLRHLDARLNCLRSLPEDLENLVDLEILNISQNFQFFTTLPDSIGFLPSLVEMDISYNKITTLPNSIGCLKTLQKIDVEGNPLVSPPKEVVEHGIDVIKEYLVEKMNNGVHKSKIKKSWLGKFVKCATFNGPINVDQTPRVSKDGFVMSDYRSIDGLASPRYMGMFSPIRLFSPKSHHAR